MICLIIGGAKSGKSMYAQNLTKKLQNNSGNMFYVATMNPSGEEDLIRINNHIKDRIGYGFKTIEIQKDLENIFSEIDKNDTLLIDSLTSIVTNEMFDFETFKNSVHYKIINELKTLGNKALNIVMVSDYVSSDSISYDSYTESFRKELGIVNREIAEYCDVVIECVFNNIIIHKGKDIRHF